MITLDALRAAALSDEPWNRLDELVRAELNRGQTTMQIYESLADLADELDDTPGLSERGSDAFGDTLDALTGMCHRDCQYRDPPNTSLPTENEIEKLPRWARVAFAARCARRVLPLFGVAWPEAKQFHFGSVENDVEVSELAASLARAPARGGDDDVAATALEAHIKKAAGAQAVARAARRAARAADCDPNIDVEYDLYNFATEGMEAAAEASDSVSIDIRPAIRRDFDHLAALAQWQHWTDDTPVPQDVFGPLWPEGPPAGWPANTEIPQRTDLALELVSAARDPDRMTEDEAVNLFNHINGYYIARTGQRLTLEDLRPLIAACVHSEV